MPVAEGHLVLDAAGAIAGHVTSVGRSITLGRTIGMAFAPPAARPGTTLTIKGERGTRVQAEVVAAPFYDPEGARQKA